MSIAQQDIERQMAQAMTTEPDLAQILIVARSEALLGTLSRQMASDDNVRGHTLCADFAAVVAAGGQNWDLLNFVVFEIGADAEADLDAVRCLQSGMAGAPQVVAVSPVPVTDAQKARYVAAGVAEVLVLAQAGASVGFDRQADAEAAPQTGAAPAPETVPEPVPEAASPAPTAPVAPAPEAVPASPAARTDARSESGGESESGVETGSEMGDETGGETGAGGDVTAFLRARGGAGATTLAVNLAVDLAADLGAGRVALIDLDLQNGSVGLALDLPDSAEATAMIRAGQGPDAGFLDRAMVRHDSGLDVLTAPDVFAPLGAMTPAMIDSLIGALKHRYDHVVLDLPQAVLDWTGPVLDQAARALIVSDMSVPSIKRVRRLIDLISEEHMTLPIRTVINFEKRPLFVSQVHKEAANLIGRPLDYWVPNEPRAARRAVDMGVPMRLGAKRSGAAKAIVGLRKSLFTDKKKG